MLSAWLLVALMVALVVETCLSNLLCLLTLLAIPLLELHALLACSPDNKLIADC